MKTFTQMHKGETYRGLLLCAIIGVLVFSFSFIAFSEPSENSWHKVQLYFGLSKPGGGVSVQEWRQFQKEVIDKRFDGYNIVDSLGYWKGNPERSKIFTIVLPEKDVGKTKEIAKEYAIRFNQQSILFVKTPITELASIGPKKTQQKNISYQNLFGEYTSFSLNTKRKSADGFIKFLRENTDIEPKIRNFPKYAIILYDAKPLDVLTNLSKDLQWSDFDIGFSAPNRMIRVKKTERTPEFVVNVGMPGAGGVSTQVAELVSLGAEIIIHIGTAGLVGESIPDNKIIVSSSAYKDGAAIMLSDPDGGPIEKSAYPNQELVDYLYQKYPNETVKSRGYTIPVFYYQPASLLRKFVHNDPQTRLPDVGYMEMEQAPFYETCRLGKIKCASLVAGSDRTIVKHDELQTVYFNHDIIIKKVLMIRMALELFKNIK